LFSWQESTSGASGGAYRRGIASAERCIMSIGMESGCVAKILKLIKNNRVVAAKTNSSRENEYVFYSFYLCSIVAYIIFLMSLKIFATQPVLLPVLRLSVVDNSDLSPNCLTILLNPVYASL
jgi:hypothetical protein